MPFFNYSHTFNCPINELFDWHKREKILERITPPWDKIRVLERKYDDSIFLKNGKIILSQELLPFIKLNWKLLHKNYHEGKSFEDVLITGPLKSWVHKHEFKKITDNKTIINDQISFTHWINFKKLNDFTIKNMEKSFNYRRKIIEYDISNQYNNPEGKFVIISGGTGLVGSDLIPMLNSLGYKILILKFNVHSDNDFGITDKTIEQENIITINWNPYSSKTIKIPQFISEKIEYLVNLSGENILGIWTKSKKNSIVNSRISSTKSLLRVIKYNSIKLKCSVHASAIGYYGTNNNKKLNESNSLGDGFLANTTNEWEKEQNKFNDYSDRNINLRIGTVLSNKGGLLKILETPAKMGFSGYIGNGENYLNWILLEDLIRIIEKTFHIEDFKGPVNAVSPTPMKSKDFFHMISKRYKSNFFIKIPSIVPCLISKELVNEIILSNQKIIPKKLIDCNYKFLAYTLDKALDNIIGV